MQSTEREIIIDEIEDLCERCKAIEFDDAGLGGVEEISGIDGKSRLRFPQTLAGLMRRDTFDPRKNDYMRRLQLDYRLEDHFPRLPILSESAFRGCPFCLFLKTAILSQDSVHAIEEKLNGATSSSIQVTLVYWWNALDYYESYDGLSYMEIELGLGSGNDLNMICLIEDYVGM